MHIYIMIFSPVLWRGATCPSAVPPPLALLQFRPFLMFLMLISLSPCLQLFNDSFLKSQTMIYALSALEIVMQVFIFIVYFFLTLVHTH